MLLKLLSLLLNLIKTVLHHLNLLLCFFLYHDFIFFLAHFHRFFLTSLTRPQIEELKHFKPLQFRINSITKVTAFSKKVAMLYSLKFKQFAQLKIMVVKLDMLSRIATLSVKGITFIFKQGSIFLPIDLQWNLTTREQSQLHSFL